MPEHGTVKTEPYGWRNRCHQVGSFSGPRSVAERPVRTEAEEPADVSPVPACRGPTVQGQSASARIRTVPVGHRQPNPLVGVGDFFVKLNAANARRFPGLQDAVKDFDAGELPAAQAAASWLKAIDVDGPQESVTTLHLLDGNLVGFYSLANGQAELQMKKRNELGLNRRTQPAVILTWIAKSARHDCDGTELVRDATYEALKVTEYSAATLLALDPFDEPTAAMWRRRYGFIDSAAPGPGRDLPRLVNPAATTDDLAQNRRPSRSRRSPDSQASARKLRSRGSSRAACSCSSLTTTR